jgi:yeast amino acid transporter
VLTVSLISCITFLVSSNSALEVFLWFVDLTTSGLIVNQTAMFVTFLGWYLALKRQGIDRGKTLVYRAPWAPYVQIFGLLLGCLGILFIGFDRFAPFTARGFITSYFGIFFAMVLFVGWTVVKKARFVDPATADVYGGKAEIDAECRIWEDGGLEENEKRRLAEMNVVRRAWEKMW